MRRAVLDQTMELLGTSNRQIAHYACKNFQMIRHANGSALQYSDLLAAALRARSELAGRLHGSVLGLEHWQQSISMESALGAMEQGGLDSGLTADFARVGTQSLLDELGLGHLLPQPEPTSPSGFHDDWAACLTAGARLQRQLSVMSKRTSSPMQELAEKLRALNQANHERVPATNLHPRAALAAQAGMVSEYLSLENYANYLGAQYACGNVQRMEAIRDAAVAYLDRFIQASDIPAGSSSALAQAGCLVLVDPLSPVTARARDKFVASQTGDAVLIGTTGGSLARLGQKPDSAVLGRMVSDMLQKMLVLQIEQSGLLSKPMPHPAEGPAIELAVQLTELARQSAVLPAGTRWLEAPTPLQLQKVVTRALASALGERILGVTPPHAERLVDMNWTDLMRVVLATPSAGNKVARALFENDPQARAQLGRAIVGRLEYWLREVPPKIPFDAHALTVNRLLAVANDGRVRARAFAEPELQRALIQGVHRFVCNPLYGAVVEGEKFEPCEDHAVGYIQRALLHVLPPAQTSGQAAKWLTSVSKHLSRPETPVMGQFLEALLAQAERAPKALAVEFLGDVGDHADGGPTQFWTPPAA